MQSSGQCDSEGGCNGPYVCESGSNLCCPVQLNIGRNFVLEIVIRLIRCVVERKVTGTCYCLLPLKSQSYKVAIYKQLSSKFEKSQQFKIIS